MFTQRLNLQPCWQCPFQFSILARGSCPGHSVQMCGSHQEVQVAVLMWLMVTFPPKAKGGKAQRNMEHSGVSRSYAFSFLLLNKTCPKLSKPFVLGVGQEWQEFRGANFQGLLGEGIRITLTGKRRIRSQEKPSGIQGEAQSDHKEGGSRALAASPLHAGLSQGLWVRQESTDRKLHFLAGPGCSWGSQNAPVSSLRLYFKAAHILFSQLGPLTRLRNIIFENMSVTWMEF